MQYIRPSVSIARGYRPMSRSRKDYPNKTANSKTKKNLQIMQYNTELYNAVNILTAAIEYTSICVLGKTITATDKTKEANLYSDALAEIEEAFAKQEKLLSVCKYLVVANGIIIGILSWVLMERGGF